MIHDTSVILQRRNDGWPVMPVGAPRGGPEWRAWWDVWNDWWREHRPRLAREYTERCRAADEQRASEAEVRAKQLRRLKRQCRRQELLPDARRLRAVLRAHGDTLRPPLLDLLANDIGDISAAVAGVEADHAA